jgi:transposase
VLEVSRLRRERRSGGKTDALDAVRAARSVLTSERPATPRAGGERQALQALVAAREGAVNAKLWQSDRKRAAGHLSHQGPSLLRWALFEAAQCAARRSSPDHAYYLDVAKRIDHNRACLSVARKLCRRAHHILRELGDDALAPTDHQPRATLVDAAA